MPEEWNQLLKSLREVALELGYDCDDPSGYGSEALESVVDLTGKLGAHLPAIDPATISTATENDGYGMPIDPKRYSKILKD